MTPATAAGWPVACIAHPSKLVDRTRGGPDGREEAVRGIYRQEARDATEKAERDGGSRRKHVCLRVQVCYACKGLARRDHSQMIECVGMAQTARSGSTGRLRDGQVLCVCVSLTLLVSSLWTSLEALGPSLSHHLSLATHTYWSSTAPVE